MRLSAIRMALASLIGTVLAGALISLVPSVASASTTPKGYVEICKTFAAGAAGAPVYQGTFHYTIGQGTGDGAWSTTVSLNALQGGPQACTAPISVPSGTLWVSEGSAPWFSVASITATQGDPGTVTASTTTPGLASVTVNPAPSPGDQSLTTTVQYTNDPVTGIVEVCKQAAANSPSLTGTYTFNITSKSSDINVWDSTTGAYDLPWTTTASATISAGGLGCSGPIVVPAGTVQTVEPGTTSVTAITASSNGTNELVSPAPNLALGTAYENVPAGNTTNQTIVTYTDALSTVKLCKAWTGSEIPTTSFPFMLSSSGPAGPTAVSGTASLTAGPVWAPNCQIVGIVRAGTQVNITEGVVPGTKVASISVSPTSNSQGVSPIVPSSLSLPNRTVSVIAGAGETDVYFTDEAADPGWLKICVDPTTNPVPTGGTAQFTVGGTQMIDVNLSSTAVQCTLDPNTFAFDSSVTIAGGSLPTGDAFSGTPSVVPTNVEVLEGGVPTATNQLSLGASTASSAAVLMSEGIVTEVTFTVDPPAPATAPTVTATPSVAQVAAATAVAASSPATSANLSPRIVRLEKQVSSVKSEIKVLLKKLSSRHLRKAARKADAKKLAALRARERGLLRELE